MAALLSLSRRCAAVGAMRRGMHAAAPAAAALCTTPRRSATMHAPHSHATGNSCRDHAWRWQSLHSRTFSSLAHAAVPPQSEHSDSGESAGGHSYSQGGSSSSSGSHHRGASGWSGVRPAFLLLSGAGVAAYLWSLSRMHGEGVVLKAPPSSLHATAAAAAAAAAGADDPLASHKLPPLIKEYRKLGFFRRMWFYVRLTCRGVLLASLWIPTLTLYILLPQHVWMKLVVRLLERSGAVFIKMGQWAATRPDLFPAEVCEQLTKLQASVKPHAYTKSLAACMKNFGRDMSGDDGSRLVLHPQVLGSGSMGQVHRGTVVSADGVVQREVAVKVLHPNIHAHVSMDLTLLYFVAVATTKIPYSELQWLSIPEMLIQFTEFMGSHLNLQQEAANMNRFRKYFAKSPNVHFPSPVYPFVGSEVLVQELAHGIPLGRFLNSEEYAAKREQESEMLRGRNLDIKQRISKQSVVLQQEAQQDGSTAATAMPVDHNPSPLHTELARLGLKMYLKMLIHDNYVHSDLHPGNLLVAFPNAGELRGEGHDPKEFDSLSGEDVKSEHVSLVVLDSGLVSELSPVNRRNFLSLFGALILRDGRLAARLMLENAPKHACQDPQALQDDMHEIVSAIPLESLAQVDLGRLLSEVMNTVRRHHVKLESDFASVIISLAIIEGIGRQLDPNLSLFHQAVPVMLKNRECRNILLETAGYKACIKLGLKLMKEEMHHKTHKDEPHA